MIDLKPEVHNEAHWLGKCIMLLKWIRTRIKLIEVLVRFDSNIKINNVYKTRVAKFTN